MASSRLPSVADMPQITRFAPTLVASRAFGGALPLSQDNGTAAPAARRRRFRGPGGPEVKASSLFHVLSLASASCTCTPRLLPSSSCHSSTTTMRTVLKTSLASARDSSAVRLSGVVTKMVGRRRAWALRSPLAVSPVRAPRVQAGAPGRPLPAPPVAPAGPAPCQPPVHASG